MAVFVFHFAVLLGAFPLVLFGTLTGSPSDVAQCDAHACRQQGNVQDGLRAVGPFDMTTMLQVERSVEVEQRRPLTEQSTQSMQAIDLSLSSFKSNASSCGTWLRPYPLQLLANAEWLQQVGELDSRMQCNSELIPMLGGIMMGDMASPRSRQNVVWPVWIVVAYGVLSIIVVGSIFCGLWRPTSEFVPMKWPNADAWRRGGASWFLNIWILSFATRWVNRWGKSDSDVTKIRADEIESMGYPEDETNPCFKRFEKLWNEEVRRVGLQQVSLLRLIFRFVTLEKIFWITFWNAGFEAVMFIAPPIVIEWVTQFIDWLYTERALGHDVPLSALVWPTCLVILFFTGIPVLMGLASTISAVLTGRLALRTGGALSCAIYRKAQRLPLTMSEQDVDDNIQSLGMNPIQSKLYLNNVKDASTAKKPFEQQAAQRKPQSDRLSHEYGDLIEETDMPSQYNLVQLVLVDVDTNLVGLPLAMGRVIVMLPVVIVIFSMVCVRLKGAFFMALGTSFLMLMCLSIIAVFQQKYILGFMNCCHERLSFFQSTIVGIRHVKSCGEEAKCQKAVENMRDREISYLKGFWTCLGCMFGVNEQFPNFILIMSLAGLCIFYGGVAPLEIFAIIPLLSSFQNSVTTCTALIPMIVMALPSLGRIEGFMKLEEAPAWVLDGKSASVTGTRVSDALRGTRPPLRMQGDFARSSNEGSALRGLNITVRPGELVAVLGQVGAGKSTLLQAMLGELYPISETRFQLPAKIAYSSQVAYIIEGSLKDNVLHGEAYEEARYNEVIHAACLLPDLKVLPGGDDVPVGSRGITLSGGQKARVSMARAAYSFDTELILLDDPFGAVDWSTAEHIMTYLVCGESMKGRTRVIALQPDKEKLKHFDRVLIIVDGEVRVDGPPSEILSSPEYESLQSTKADAFVGDSNVPDHAQSVSSMDTPNLNKGHPMELREEEFQGRADVTTLKYFMNMGGWTNMALAMSWVLTKNVFEMMMRLVLASWTTAGSLYASGISTTPIDVPSYFMKYLFWWSLAIVCWCTGWTGGQIFTIRISRGGHQDLTKALLDAPIDRFFDKTPVGRIMNRLTQDQVMVDTQLFVKVCSAICFIWSIGVPLLFVHILMPLLFTLGSLPVYYLAFTLFRMYWRTMVPLRYTVQTCRSHASAELSEIDHNAASVRAYMKLNFRFHVFQMAITDVLQMNYIHDTILKRWLSCRLFLINGFFVTWIAIIAIWVDALTVGNAAFCIVQIFQVLIVVDNVIEISSAAQYQIVAMNRIHEYTKLPREKDAILPTDSSFIDFSVTISREDLGTLEKEYSKEGVHVVRPAALRKALLWQVPGKVAFQAAPGCHLSDLCPNCEMLGLAHPWHRIVGVNRVDHSASEMAKELCSGKSEEVVLLIKSGWLADGATVVFENLRAGYADIPVNVLTDVNVEIPRKCKVGIAGHSGCGKSSMLLCVLRIIEPRSGLIKLEGIDTQSLGLRTLRSAIGVVPQDPVLLQGTLRSNLDPFNHHSDRGVWNALRQAQLDDVVKSLEGQLESSIAAGGSNLSFGQRQLVSLARIILRKPSLLMLDEATSAIDPCTQEVVLSTLLTSFHDATMMVVTHRLETILIFDRAIVMEKGRVAEYGPVEELVEHGLHFGKLTATRAYKRLQKDVGC